MSLTSRVPDAKVIRPSDPVFASWVGDAGVAAIGHELVWAPQGMGALCTTNPPYDSAYFEKYRRYTLTAMGRAITAARIDLVRRHAGGAAHVVDVGIGCGDFIMARGGWTWGYDVNPRGEAWLRENGRWLNPYERPSMLGAVTMWDVLEHIAVPHRLLDLVKRWVFLSLPIVPGSEPPSTSWKHYKPEEHCWYWTESGLVLWMAAHGFVCREMNRVETELGREDIGTFAFERANRDG